MKEVQRFENGSKFFYFTTVNGQVKELDWRRAEADWNRDWFNWYNKQVR